MMPEKRKPLAGKTSGLLEMSSFAGLNSSEDTAPALHLQVHSLRNRFSLSLPLARRVAELAFAKGGAR